MLLGIPIETLQHVLWTLLLAAVFLVGVSGFGILYCTNPKNYRKSWSLLDEIVLDILYMAYALVAVAIVLGLMLTTYAIWN